MSYIDIFLVLLLNLIWGSAFTFSGYAMIFYAPIFAYFIRFFSVGICTIPFYKFPRKYFYNILILSLLQSITFCGVALGIKYLDSSTTAILTRLDIIFTVLLGAIIFREKLSINVIIGIILCFLAVYIISGNIQIRDLKYLILVIFAMLTSGLANIVVKTIKDVDNMTIVSWTSFFMGIELFLVSFFTEKQFILKPLNFNSIFVMVYLGIISSFLAYLLFYYLLRKYSIAQIMPYNFLRPIISIVFGYILLSEPITFNKIIGVIMILLGIFISQYDFKNKQKIDEQKS